MTGMVGSCSCPSEQLGQTLRALAGKQEAKDMPPFLYLICPKAALDCPLSWGPRGPELEHFLQTLCSSKPALVTTKSQGFSRDKNWEEDKIYGNPILLRS